MSLHSIFMELPCQHIKSPSFSMKDMCWSLNSLLERREILDRIPFHCSVVGTRVRPLKSRRITTVLRRSWTIFVSKCCIKNVSSKQCHVGLMFPVPRGRHSKRWSEKCFQKWQQTYLGWYWCSFLPYASKNNVNPLMVITIDEWISLMRPASIPVSVCVKVESNESMAKFQLFNKYWFVWCFSCYHLCILIRTRSVLKPFWQRCTARTILPMQFRQ